MFTASTVAEAAFRLRDIEDLLHLEHSGGESGVGSDA